MSTFDLDAHLDSLDEIGTRQCKEWRNAIFRRHQVLAPYLISGYRKKAKQRDYVAANCWLREMQSRLRIGDTPLTVGSEDEAIRDYAKVVSRSMKNEVLPRVRLQGPLAAFGAISSAVARAGVKLDVSTDSAETKIAGVLKRICDEHWWFRKLRTLQRRGFESIVRELGYVSVNRNIYVSDLTLHRRGTQKRSNRVLLERMLAENEEGQRFTLAELSDLSPSNPIVRRAELMVRMRGLENIAIENPEDYAGLFFTLTCPSKYHAVLKTGGRNSKFDGLNPLQAQAHLNLVWTRTRSAWDKHGVHPFGMRVVEPNHDGTPHWHLVLFVPKGLADLTVEIFRKYALEEDGDENGAEKHRLTTKVIDHARGSATGYLAKYIAKNIDGFGLDADHYGKDAVIAAIRIEAWASTWGIRQFQQIGGPGVTVWRELRRLDKNPEEGEFFESVRLAADESDWSEYTALMGGAICRREDRPLRPMMVEKEGLNGYGEIITSLKGIWYGARAIVSRFHIWTVSVLPIPLRGISAGATGVEPGEPLGENPYKGLPRAFPGGEAGDFPYKGISRGESFKGNSNGIASNASETLGGKFFGAAPDGAGNLEYCQ